MKMNIARPGVGALAVLCLAAASGHVQANEADLRFSTGGEYSTGTYGGTEDIEELYVPFTMRLDYERAGFRFTVPWLRVSESGAASTESGVGDVIATATLYDVYVGEHGDFVETIQSPEYGLRGWLRSGELRWANTGTSSST